MARTKKNTKKAAVPKTTRPYNALFVTILAVAAAAALWWMRIETGMKGIPLNFVENVEARTYPNGMPMRTHYTGIEAIDNGLLFLVAAFIAGPLAWDEGVRLHQLHFLVQFFAVIAVWNVEACRARHSWKLVSFTGLFVLFYQTIAGAAIIPLYYIAFLLTSSSDAYYVGGRQVTPSYARSLLLSISVGYLLPTLAMYYPFFPPSVTQFLVFLWQPSPGFVNILLFTGSLCISAVSSSSAQAPKTADVKHLKRIYLVAGLVCAINHLVTLYVCATSTHPQLSFTYVFLPDRSTMEASTTAGLHYIFQIDWWGCFLPTLLWAWISVSDVYRLLLGGAGVGPLIKWAVYIVGLTVALGPGSMLAVVWYWREEKLVALESGKRAKPKTT
ncbi:hypothetical protein F4808DRAFT_4480 [Astrocystis sublimbata]|nr:hypothetical protein F4808DRAFT_4480 [Astrocystis sublimbata]